MLNKLIFSPPILFRVKIKLTLFTQVKHKNTYLRTDPSIGKLNSTPKKAQKWSDAAAKYGFFSTTLISYLQRPYDVSFKGTERLIRKKLENYERSKQVFLPKRHALVGE